MTETGNESPQSISFTAYYKGYAVTVTKRNATASELIKQTEEEIDRLSANNDWKPSWNAQTNKDLVDPEWIKAKQTNETGECTHVNKTIKISSGFKKPENKGRKYESCLDCNKFIGWIA